MCRTLNSKEGFTKIAFAFSFCHLIHSFSFPRRTDREIIPKTSHSQSSFFVLLGALCHRHLPVLLGALLIHVCLPMFLSSVTSVSAASFCGCHGHFHFFMCALRKTMSRIDQDGIQKPVCNFLGNKCKPYRCHTVVL